MFEIKCFAKSLIFGFVLFAGCASITAALAEPFDSRAANIIRVPLMRQATNYTCGIAALQAILAYYGEDVREDVLARALRANHKDGTRYSNIAKYGQAHGLSVQIEKEMTIAQLRTAIRSGHPVLC